MQHFQEALTFLHDGEVPVCSNSIVAGDIAVEHLPGKCDMADVFTDKFMLEMGQSVWCWSLVEEAVLASRLSFFKISSHFPVSDWIAWDQNCKPARQCHFSNCACCAVCKPVLTGKNHLSNRGCCTVFSPVIVCHNTEKC